MFAMNPDYPPGGSFYATWLTCEGKLELQDLQADLIIEDIDVEFLVSKDRLSRKRVNISYPRLASMKHRCTVLGYCCS